MIENVKINCPECNALLNMKIFDKHMSKVHNIYNISATIKTDLYRKIEDIKELARNTTDTQEIKVLQSKYYEFKNMLSPVPINKQNKILKSKIAAYNKFSKSTDEESNSISYRKNMKHFSKIIGGVLRAENSKGEIHHKIGTKKFLDLFISLAPEMIESFIGQKESTELSIKINNKKSDFNLTQEQITYNREIKQLSIIAGGFIKTENSKREIRAEIGTKEFQEIFVKLIPEIIEFFIRKKAVANTNQELTDLNIETDNKNSNPKISIEKKEIDQGENNPIIEVIIKDDSFLYDTIYEDIDDDIISDESKTISQEAPYCNEIKTFDKETYWEENSPIKEPTIIDNVLKHHADTFQFKADEELDPDMIIDEEQYQEEFINNLSKNKINIVKTERVVFQKNIVDKEESDIKSDIKIFLSKMYKGYCQVCGFTFKKINGDNSFEMFNWNDKRVVKIKKTFISTADSLCLCRNCSANVKWGAFKPVFIDKVKNIEDFKSKKSDEIKILLHNLVDKEVPDVFKSLLEFDDMYALEIELRDKPRNIYFTNEHLLQFIAYLQTEDEFEEELLEKKIFREQENRINTLSNRLYSTHSWLKREETIPLSLAEGFIRNATYWDHPKACYYVHANHSHRIKNDYQHGWSVKFGGNYFLVGKAIERCKKSINEYIEKINNGNNGNNGNNIEINILRDDLEKHISGAVATSNNYEYDGYYPIEEGYMKFGTQAIHVIRGANFLIRELGLDELNIETKDLYGKK